MNQEINIAPNTDVLSLIGLGNRPSVAGATLLTDMKMIKDLGREFISEKSNQKRHLGVFEKKLDAVVAYNNFVLENNTPHSLNKI